MLSQPPFWLIVLAFVLAIGPLVFIHEMGHYLVARWFGIGAEVCSFGFGRELAGFTDRRGTRWRLSAIPLGGYVRFVGDMNAASQADADADLPADKRSQAFHNKPVWQRFLVVLAGPAANFLLAILIFAGFLMAFGMRQAAPVVSQVVPASAAAQAGVQAGDRIAAINGRRIEDFGDIARYVVLRPGQHVAIDLIRADRPLRLQVRLGDVQRRDQFGQPFRAGELGVAAAREVRQPVPLTRLLPEATKLTFALTRWMVDGLVQIITGQRSVKDMGGPLKMAQVAGQQASLGALEFVQLIALFSINLGFINLLPVPMLDGGHLMFYAAEAVRRRPLSGQAQEWAFRGGLALLLALMLFLTANDLVSFGLFQGLGRLIG